MIFDEVNQENDTLRHIDLTCLDHEDALMITLEKICDLADHAAIQ